MTAGVATAQQRDPAYQAARAAGQIGEKPDGYLGIVGASSSTLQAIVDDINMRRRAVYTERARNAGSTAVRWARERGDADALARWTRAAGCATSWTVAGPFGPYPMLRFDETLPPEEPGALASA